ncbi:hypothetical protein [Streptomyces sp. NPDC047009]|uniref:hypothetical protein n=1 Tax=Streptomyces sp. NPDC047009 TaxID=3154496 RepID=UPI0033DC3217
MSAELLEAAPASDASVRKFRGKNKGKRWMRGDDNELAVIRLPLDVSRLDSQHRVEQLYSAMWSVKLALQRDARAAVDAYWPAMSAARTTRRPGG